MLNLRKCIAKIDAQQFQGLCRQTSHRFAHLSCYRPLSRPLKDQHCSFLFGKKTTFSKPVICNKHTRHLSTTPITYSDQNKIIKEWTYDLHYYGKFNLDSQSIDCEISPIDPNDFPEQDRVIVSLHGKDDDDQAVDCDVVDGNVFVRQTKSTNGAFLDVKVPIKFDLSLNLKSNTNVLIHTMENDSIKVMMNQGTCTMKNIKSGNVMVTSKSGDIISEKGFQGNAMLRTAKQGKVSLYRPLGEELSVETESGEVHVESLYSKKCYINTRRGDVRIGTCNSDAMVNIQHTGNLKIATLDGSILASLSHGDADIHVTKHNDLQVMTYQGNIDIKLMRDEPTQVQLTADNVTISDDLQTDRLHTTTEGQQQLVTRMLGKQSEGPLDQHTSIVATTKSGNINISKLDWIHTLGIKNFKLERED